MSDISEFKKLLNLKLINNDINLSNHILSFIFCLKCKTDATNCICGRYLNVMKFPVLDTRKNGCYCDSGCGIKDFFICANEFVNFIHCPNCSKIQFDYEIDLDTKDFGDDFDEEKLFGDCIYICKNCNIIIKDGKEHSFNGRYSIYYAKFINKFKFNGKIYNNVMPLFKNFKHAITLYKLLEDVEWKCSSPDNIPENSCLNTEIIDDNGGMNFYSFTLNNYNQTLNDSITNNYMNNFAKLLRGIGHGKLAN